MDSPHWNACADFFKHQFPSCQKCQEGYDTPEELKVHLAVVHFHQEALRVFGKQQSCSVCAKVICPPKEAYRQQFILYHMSRHLSLIAPGDAKPFLLVAMDLDGVVDKEEDKLNVDNSSDSLPENNDNKCERFSERNVSESDSLTETLAPKSDGPQRGVPKAKNQLGQQKNTSAYILSGPPRKACIKFLKREYPECQTCHASFRNHHDVIDHMLLKHYRDLSLEHYGQGNMCAVCKKFTVSTSSQMLKDSVVQRTKQRHMKRHLDLIFSGEVKELFGFTTGLEGQPINNSFKKPVSKAKTTKKRPKSQKRHQPKRLKQIVKEQPPEELANKGIMSDPSWVACEDFFKETFPTCAACQQGHDTPLSLKQHLASNHYGRTAVELFGNGTNCPICNEKVLVTNSDSIKTKSQTISILEHMSQHLEEFILGKGKTLIKKAMEVTVTNNSSESSQKLPNIVDVSRQVSPRPRKEKPKPIVEKSCHMPVRRNFKPNLEIHPDMLKPHWQDCEAHFSRLFGDYCNSCSRGHKSPFYMKRHVTYMHYKERAIRLFGKGNVCAICKKVSVPTDVKQEKRLFLIKCHMALHLEMFIEDEEARVLLLKAKSYRKKRGKSGHSQVKAEPMEELGFSQETKHAPTPLNHIVSIANLNNNCQVESSKELSKVEPPPSGCPKSIPDSSENTPLDKVRDEALPINVEVQAPSLTVPQSASTPMHISHSLTDEFHSTKIPTEAVSDNPSAIGHSLHNLSETLVTPNELGNDQASGYNPDDLCLKLEESPLSAADSHCLEGIVDELLVNDNFDKLLTDEFLSSTFDIEAENLAPDPKQELPSEEDLTLKPDLQGPICPPGTPSHQVTPNASHLQEGQSYVEDRKPLQSTETKLTKQVPSQDIAARDSVYWAECHEFFKRTFSHCMACQREKKQFGDMLGHLFMTHYKKPVLLAYGDFASDICQMCPKETAKPVEFPEKRNRKQIVVRHFMTRHKQFLIESVEDADAREALAKTVTGIKLGRKRKSNILPKREVGTKRRRYKKVPCYPTGWRQNKSDFQEDRDEDVDDKHLITEGLIVVDEEEEKGFWIMDDDFDYEY